MTQKKLEHIKKNISLIDFARTYGFTFVKDKKSEHSATLKKDDTKIIVSKNSNGHYIFFDLNDPNRKGSIIDFHKSYVNDKNVFWQTIKDIEKWEKNPTSIPPIKLFCSKFNPDSIVKTWEQFDSAKLNRYLESRYINKKTFELFKNTIKIDTFKNTCFVHKSYKIEDDKFMIDIIGIEKKNKDFKQHIGKKGIWGATINGNSKDVYIFESPIDAMSYYQLHKKSGVYVAIGGSPSPTQLEDLKSVILQSKSQKLHLCFDNDEGGKTIAKRIIDFFFPLQAKGLNIDTIKPKKKDFNEDLEKREKVRSRKSMTEIGI